MELFEEFYNASMLPQPTREESAKKFADLHDKSNLAQYIEHHLTDEQNLEVADFWLEIIECKSDMYHEKHKKWLSQEKNWQPFDGNYYAEIAKKSENTSWLVPLLKVHTKCAIDGYFVYLENKFDEKKSIVARHVVQERVREKYPRHQYCIDCPKDGEIKFVVYFDEDDLTPVFVDRIQLWGLSFKDAEEFQEDSLLGEDDRFPWVEENFLLRYPSEWWTGEKLTHEDELTD